MKLKLSSLMLFLLIGSGPVAAQAPAPIDTYSGPASLWSVGDTAGTVQTAINETVAAAVAVPAPALAPGSVMPAWLKWGLVGGVATGSLAALLSKVSIDVDPPGAAESAARGFVIGFAVIGSGVAVWQLVCRSDSWSRRNGLCTPQR